MEMRNLVQQAGSANQDGKYFEGGSGDELEWGGHGWERRWERQWKELFEFRVPAERLVYAVLQLTVAAWRFGFAAAASDFRALEPAEPRAATRQCIVIRILVS